MIANRRLIETIRGRATAGDLPGSTPLAARPRIVRALVRTTAAVGGAGLCCALVAGGGAPLVRAAASAAVGAHGGYGDQPAPDAAAAAAMSVTAAVPASASAVPAVLAVPPPPAPPVATLAAATAPPAAVAAVAAVPSPGSVEAIIHEVFGAAGAAAVGVARCESGLNPAAVSRGGGNWGLFQINTVHRGRVAAMGHQWEDLLDPRVNSLVARAIFQEQGWQPWGCRRAAG